MSTRELALVLFLVIFVIPTVWGLGFGFWCRSIAARKGRSPVAAFWFGFFFGGFALIVIALAPPGHRAEDRRRLPSLAPWWVAVVAGYIFLALLIVYYVPVERARADNTIGQFSTRENAAMTAAAVETANLLTYHRATFTADYDRAVNGATGALKKDIAGKRASTLSTLTKGKFDLTARVTHQALVGPAGKNGMVVLISVNGYKSTAPDVPTQQNLQVTMTEVGSRWLASNVQTPGVS